MSSPYGPYRNSAAEAYAEAADDRIPYAVLATCSSGRITVEVYEAKNEWAAFAQWLDCHNYHGYTGVGRRKLGPPAHAEIDLISGGEVMERALVVPAAALEEGA